jgi:hypothetical protein
MGEEVPAVTESLVNLETVIPRIPLPEGAVVTPKPEIVVESWRTFEQAAGDRIPALVEGIWPEGSLGFIASPPKKGKTWLAIGLGLSIATGNRYLGRYYVPAARNVLYVALEGHRAALRSRIGCIARGLGVDPDEDEIPHFHLTYKPRGINIANPDWANALIQQAIDHDHAIVIVDVLRAAARIKENSSEDFAALRDNLEPLLAMGRSVAILHHFGKLTEITKDRTPAERMSGSGAMHGALDVGMFITGSHDGARKLRVEFDMRDIATPDTIGVHLEGEGNGDNGGFVYTDTATFAIRDETPEERDVKAPAEEIMEYVLEQGGEVLAADVRAYFDISDHTLTARLGRLHGLGIDYVSRRGKPGRFVAREPEDEQLPLSDPSTEVVVPKSSELRNFPAQQSQNGDPPNSTEVTQLRNSETPDLQGQSSSEVPNSPTERAPVRTALRISENENDHETPDDDPGAWAQPDPEPANGRIPFSDV